MPSSPRAALIREVLEFARSARDLSGVLRVAIVGSLATEKPDPKDADLLVVVSDDADLAPLAALARRLQGKAQSLNRGGEVFLAEPGGKYLGRICPWKLCGPGYRASCDALNCGRRLHLHDDLRDIRLSREVVLSPPIELWPEFLFRVPVPDDVRTGLLDRLRPTVSQ